LNSTYIRKFHNTNVDSGNDESKYGSVAFLDKSSIPGNNNPYTKILYNGLDFYINSSSSATLRASNLGIVLDLSNLDQSSLNVVGNLSANRVYNAVYNDYAELYERDDIHEQIEPGDVIELNPDTLKYRKCKNTLSGLVVGVCSDSYGHLLGGDKDCTLEENLYKYIPIGIAGRVYVKVSSDLVKPGDLLVSDGNGYATSINNIKNPNIDFKGKIIGKCLSYPKNDKILMQIMLQ
jgi:hypothetical protein